MKSIALFFVFIISTFIYSQADLSISLRLSDNATPPNNGSWEIIFGLDSTATDGLDPHLGELYVPPDVCCGWGTGLCAMFRLPNDPNSVWKDYRYGIMPYSTTKEHRIWYCAHSTATVLTIQCSLPPGVTGLLQDPLTGNLIHIEMSDSNEYYITNYIGAFFLRLIVDYQTITPVELTSFTASVSENSVNLNWQTATESNNSGFSIERLKDSKIERINEWENIGFVEGQGTTTEPQSYTFTDNDIVSGKVKYRLKQIDFDGTFAYSNEIDVDVNLTPKEFVLHQNYPNPFNPTTKIKFTIPVVETRHASSQHAVSLKVYDILGNEVATLVNENKPAGTYEVEFNSHSDEGQNLTSGIYFYRVKVGRFIQTKKMILMK